MKTENTPVSQLRDERLNEAATKLYFEDLADPNPMDMLPFMINFAKSDAVKQYHASSPVDLETIKQEFDCLIYNGKTKPSNDDIFNFFKSYLSTTSQQKEIDRLKKEVYELHQESSISAYHVIKQQLSDLQGKMEKLTNIRHCDECGSVLKLHTNNKHYCTNTKCNKDFQ